uniref:Cell number regulator 6 n=1 Tax=Oryza punctata TaxID=4537 RepID=A0A0E0K7I4_ORYPU
MAEETTLSHPSRYVKLSRDQDAPAAAEDIRPGELNQPVHVPQARTLLDLFSSPPPPPPYLVLEGRRCSECGQVLPESYEPPADEPWTTGIFACTDDPQTWIALALLTAIFHGVDPRTSFLIGEGLVFSWWLCATYTGIFRQELQRKYHLKNSPCDPCMVHCCLHWCANCQEHRERKGRLAENNAVPMTVVNPPAVQEMSMTEIRGPVSPGMENGAPSNSKSEHVEPKSDHDDVEVIPL